MFVNRRSSARKPDDVETGQNPGASAATATAKTSSAEVIPTTTARRRAVGAVVPRKKPLWPETAVLKEGGKLSPSEKEEMKAFFESCRKTAKSQATNYKIGDINRVKLIQDPRIIGSAIVCGFLLAVYFGVKHTGISNPAEEVKKAINAVKSMLGARDKELLDSVGKTFEEQLRALGDRLLEDGRKNVTMTLDYIRELVEPVLGANGSLASKLNKDSDAAIEKMLKLGSDVVSGAGDTGATAIASAVTARNNWNMTAAVTDTFAAIMQMVTIPTAFMVNTMDSVGKVEQQLYNLINDDEAWRRLEQSPEDYQVTAWRIIEDLQNRFLDNKRLLNGIPVKVDAVACMENFEWLDKLIVNRPTEKMPVDRWADDNKLRDYILEVDAETFPKENQAAFEYLCHGPAVDSLHPNHIGGPTYVTLIGDPATGKTYAAERSVEINGTPSSEADVPPQQMGEGGAADILTKTWDAVRAKNFKTSPLQLLGCIMRSRLHEGRNIPGHPNGVLNHVTIMNEAPVDDPEFHRIMKLFENFSDPRWPIWTLGVKSFTGAGVFVKTTNAKMNSGTPPANVRNDRALVSRQHEIGRAGRSEDSTVQKDIQKFHEMALSLYSEECKYKNGEAPLLDEYEIGEVKKVFEEVRGDIFKNHRDYFSGARVEYAMVLTKHLCFNQLKKKLFPTREEIEAKGLTTDGMKDEDFFKDDASRKASGVRVKTLDEIKEMIDIHYDAVKEGVL